VLLIFCFTVNHRFIEGVGSIKKIAFHATLNHHLTLGQSQTVIFDHVITNNGNCYNIHSGLFTSPRDGTYYFTTSFLSKSGSAHLQMMRNAEIIGSGTGYPDTGSTGSISATVNLKKGDAVKIRHWKGMSTQGLLGPYPIFTGFIL
jgi:hypothetical protein